VPDPIRFIFLIGHDAAVRTSRDVEVEVPPKIFLPGLVVRFHPCLSKPRNQPFGKVVTKTASDVLKAELRNEASARISSAYSRSVQRSA
jgi:hypothetical protein